MTYKLIINTWIHTNFKTNCILFYNTLDGSFIESKEKDIINFFSGVENSLVDYNTVSQRVSQFIDNLRNRHFVEILNNEQSIKPPIIINNGKITVNDFKKISKGVSINNVNDYLIVLNIYISSACSNSINYTDVIYKQFPHCFKDNSCSIMSFEDIKIILKNIPINTKTNILGGDILSHPDVHRIVDYIDNNKSLSVTIYVNANNFTLKDIETINQLTKYVEINIVVDINHLLFINSNLNFLSKKNVEFTFLVDSEKSYNLMGNSNSELLEYKHNFQPFYTGKNLNFFEKNIFLNKDDILSQTQTLKAIEIKKVVNTQFIGKLSITPNGNMYTNLLNDSIGNIFNDKIQDIIENELKNKKNWFEIRENKDTCSSCIYNNLCPSVSNFEMLIGKHNLCFYNPYIAKWEGEKNWISVDEWNIQNGKD